MCNIRNIFFIVLMFLPYTCLGFPTTYSNSDLFDWKTPYRIFVNRDIKCLQDAILSEATGEPLAGQWLVGKVVLNRVGRGHPNSVCMVVYEASRNKDKPWACQFSFTCNKTVHKKSLQARQQAARIARQVLEDQMFYDLSEDARWFKRCEIRRVWTKNMVLVTKSGKHCFYRS